jgi:hypothetical protein
MTSRRRWKGRRAPLNRFFSPVKAKHRQIPVNSCLWLQFDEKEVKFHAEISTSSDLRVSANEFQTTSALATSSSPPPPACSWQLVDDYPLKKDRNSHRLVKKYFLPFSQQRHWIARDHELSSRKCGWRVKVFFFAFLRMCWNAKRCVITSFAKIFARHRESVHDKLRVNCREDHEDESPWESAWASPMLDSPYALLRVASAGCVNLESAFECVRILCIPAESRKWLCVSWRMSGNLVAKAPSLCFSRSREVSRIKIADKAESCSRILRADFSPRIESVEFSCADRESRTNPLRQLNCGASRNLSML